MVFREILKQEAEKLEKLLDISLPSGWDEGIEELEPKLTALDAVGYSGPWVFHLYKSKCVSTGYLDSIYSPRFHNPILDWVFPATHFNASIELFRCLVMLAWCRMDETREISVRYSNFFEEEE